MSAPFYNAIKGTTAGTPGTGAFTPNAASAGFLAWSTVPTLWMGLVRYEDGSSWELTYSYWNGTTLSRASTQMLASSSGSAISLTSAATAAMIEDAYNLAPNLGVHTGMARGAFGSATFAVLGTGGVNNRGTNNGVNIATTNYLTEQPRTQFTSVTTANAQAGVDCADAQAVYSTASGRGGFEMVVYFGCSGLPTAPRLFIGLTSAAYFGSNAEPSAFNNNFAILGLDSTDTNLQFMTNDAGVTAGKTNTGIPLVANGWYGVSILAPAGGGKVCFRLFRLDTGAIYYAERTTDLPANGSLMKWNILGGLNGTDTGTAMVLCAGSMLLRTG